MDYSKFISAKAKEIKPSGIRRFFNMVQEMPDAISLGVGEPDFDTPKDVTESAIQSLREGKTFYTPNNGLLELRELIAKYYETRYSVSYDPKTEIMVTVGASEAIDLACRVLLNEGDEVIVPEPCFVSYNSCVTLAGGIPVNIPCYAKDNFAVTAEAIERAVTPKTKAVLLSFPNNPTGAVLLYDELVKIADLAKKHDIIIITDEIYSELSYGIKHISIASLPGMRERCVVINGFSKSFAMTGWRIGYLLAPKEITETVYKIHQQTIMCAPTMAQIASIKALKQGFKDDFATVKGMANKYNERRIYLVDRLNKMGLTCFEPKGAFYAFPDVRATGLNGDQFAEELLAKKKVAVVPGSAFGAGEHYIRISYAYSIESIKRALDLIEEFVAEKKSEK